MKIVSRVPFSASQQELWLAAELGGTAAKLAFQEGIVLDFAGHIDAECLRAAWNSLVRGHEALRATVSSDGLTVTISEEGLSGWFAESWADLSPELSQERRRVLLLEEANTVLDLSDGPPFRVRWVDRGNGRGFLVLTVSQMVCDRVSLGILLKKLQHTYVTMAAGGIVALPVVPWSAAGPSADDFWTKTLGRSPHLLELPTDFSRPRQRTYATGRSEVLLSRDVAAGLRSMVRGTGVGLPDVLLAAWQVFLARISGQESFLVAVSVPGQTRPELAETVGASLEMVPLATHWTGSMSCLDQARLTTSFLAEAKGQRVPPLSLLQSALSLPHDPSRIPLTPVAFEFLTPLASGSFGAVRAEATDNPSSFKAFELILSVCDLGDELVLSATFNLGLYLESTVVRWLEDLLTLIGAFSAAPQTPWKELPLLSPVTQDLLFKVWNQPAKPLPLEETTLDLFEARVSRHPHAIAVGDGVVSLSYRELNERANFLAAKLMENGVVPGDLVGINSGRSVQTLAALLAVWKVGAAYVPLDPHYPPARLAFIAHDAGLKALMTEHTSEAGFLEGTWSRVWIDREVGQLSTSPGQSCQRTSLAYVLHTSGSTGKPKGVQIEHGSLLNLLVSMASRLTLGTGDVLLAVTTLSFDIAGLELFLPLVTGAQVVLVHRDDAVDGARLLRRLSETKASVLQATPSTWRLLLDAGWAGTPGLQALCGGEAMPPSLAEQLLPRCRSLWNVYGPTETTIWSTAERVERAADAVSIGCPLDNTSVYIVDPQMRALPIGAVGELLIGGSGVARGYLNRPDLTRERFLDDPFSIDPGTRVYRTGDLCRFGADGRIFFQGRNDQQVKLRGFRIELGEIESVVSSFPGVEQAVLSIREFSDGDVRLVAHLVCGTSTVDSNDVKAFVAGRLPAYMVPQHVLTVATLPLTPNGKIDRKALPLPEFEEEIEDNIVEDLTPVQAQLLEIWQSVLGVPKMSILTNFFDLGGHSLSATRVRSRIRDQLGVDLPLQVIFQNQTIDSLSTRVELALLVARTGTVDRSSFIEIEI